MVKIFFLCFSHKSVPDTDCFFQIAFKNLLYLTFFSVLQCITKTTQHISIFFYALFKVFHNLHFKNIPNFQIGNFKFVRLRI